MNKSILKKIAVFTATVLTGMVFLCGCGGDTSADEEPGLPSLVIGSDYYEPYIYLDDNGEFVGMDVQLITEICKHIGYKAVFKNIEWGMKNEILASGEVDALCGCFSVTGREDEYAWTLPYMNSRQVVAVPESSDIYEIADLNGKRVAVQATTKPDELFSGMESRMKGPVPELYALNTFPNMSYIFAAISEGFVDAIAGHEIALREYMKSSSVKLRILEEPLLEVKLGIAFGKDTHAEIIEKINQTLYLLKHNGFLSELVSSYGLDPDLYLVDYEKNE